MTFTYIVRIVSTLPATYPLLLLALVSCLLFSIYLFIFKLSFYICEKICNMYLNDNLQLHPFPCKWYDFIFLWLNKTPSCVYTIFKNSFYLRQQCQKGDSDSPWGPHDPAHRCRLQCLEGPGFPQHRNLTLRSIHVAQVLPGSQLLRCTRVMGSQDSGSPLPFSREKDKSLPRMTAWQGA